MSHSILAFFLAFLTLPLMGQEDLVFHAESRLVVLHTTVVDRSGKLLTDLPQKAFKVYENNVEQEVRLFRHEDIPISLGLVIDNSASMREKRRKVEAAALQLVKASIINFSDSAFLDCPFTNSIPKLQAGLARIDSRGTTAMRDAIGMSIDYMKNNAKLDKKILLVVSDGDDNLSELTLEQIVRQAQQAEVLIYAIGLLSEEDRSSARKAQKALDTIAEASGGAAYYPQELAEVDQIALRVAHEVRNQFTIGADPRWEPPADSRSCGRPRTAPRPHSNRLLRHARTSCEAASPQSAGEIAPQWATPARRPAGISPLPRAALG